MLAGFRLVIMEVGGTESDQPPESILTQDPPAGQSVAIGSPVRVTVATPRTVIVPQSGADGAERGGSGTGGVEASDDVIGQVADLLPAGAVVSQASPAGARAAQGTAVNVTLSLGPQVAVPSLVGKNVGDATTIVRAAGLVLVSTRVEGAPGIVMEQEPAAGTLVSPGSETQITVGRFMRPPPRGPLGPPTRPM